MLLLLNSFIEIDFNLIFSVSLSCSFDDMSARQSIKVESPNVRYQDNYIEADYEYEHVMCQRTESGDVRAFPRKTKMTFRTQSKVPRLGVMLVGWGGNNGSTVTAAILANRQKLSWRTKDGLQTANYFGSLTQCSTVLVGKDESDKDLYMPMRDLLPMVDPNDIELDGWDISSANLAESMRRACVIDVALQDQLWTQMEQLRPRPALFDADFVAANQLARADNVMPEKSKQEQVDRLRQDIRDFKASRQLDSVLVLWTANTERYVEAQVGVLDTADNLLKAIERDEKEISPSILYAVASVLEGVSDSIRFIVHINIGELIGLNLMDNRRRI
jgi:myo-inositol-1-phosphate synthase